MAVSGRVIWRLLIRTRTSRPARVSSDTARERSAPGAMPAIIALRTPSVVVSTAAGSAASGKPATARAFSSARRVPLPVSRSTNPVAASSRTDTWRVFAHR